MKVSVGNKLIVKANGINKFYEQNDSSIALFGINGNLYYIPMNSVCVVEWIKSGELKVNFKEHNFICTLNIAEEILSNYFDFYNYNQYWAKLNA